MATYTSQDLAIALALYNPNANASDLTDYDTMVATWRTPDIPVPSAAKLRALWDRYVLDITAPTDPAGIMLDYVVAVTNFTASAPAQEMLRQLYRRGHVSVVDLMGMYNDGRLTVDAAERITGKTAAELLEEYNAAQL
jgi:hypothetical protein